MLQTFLNVTEAVLATFIGKSYAERLNAAYDELQELVERVSVELKIGTVVESLGK